MNEAAARAVMERSIVAACRKSTDWIPGAGLGSKPKFFIVGDEPIDKDYIVRTPFSGALNEVLSSAFFTLKEKYGTAPEDCYITYLVKTNYSNPGELTSELIEKEWLEILKLEYQLSGCDTVVCLGSKSRQYAGYIPRQSTLVQSYSPSIVEKLRQIWQVIAS